jgi:predicted CoA-binding protein
MNAEEAMPVTVECVATKPKDGALYDVPPRMEVTYEFKNPDWTLIWAQPGVKEGKGAYGAKYWGDKDTLVVNGGDGGTDTEEKAMKYQPPADGVKVFRSPGHHENFFQCMRSREKPIMWVEYGVHVAALNNLGNAAYLAGKKITWDPAKEKTDDDKANAFLFREPRGKYKFPDPI